jgi:glycosyltransferase involved in cell wall biosynthesis
MKISIVTISFNQKKYLAQCLESILSQDRCELEYIVVDPGSTDGSRELIESYGDRIVRVFEPDGGPAAGLIKGFARATGDVFGFVNSDDYLLPNALYAVSVFFNNNSGQCFMTGSGYIENSTGQVVQNRQKKIHPSPLTSQSMLYRSAVMFQQATFFPATLYRQVNGFNPQNRTCWDYELFLRFLLVGAKHTVVDSELAVFRLSDESISGSGRLTQQYLSDLDQIFIECTGRERSIKDKAFTYYLRLCRELRRYLAHV